MSLAILHLATISLDFLGSYGPQNHLRKNYNSAKITVNCITYSVIFRLSNIISKCVELQEPHDYDIGNKAETTKKSPY